MAKLLPSHHCRMQAEKYTRSSVSRRRTRTTRQPQDEAEFKPNYCQTSEVETEERRINANGSRVSKVGSTSETIEGSKERSRFCLPQSPLSTRCKDREDDKTTRIYLSDLGCPARTNTSMRSIWLLMVVKCSRKHTAV